MTGQDWTDRDRRAMARALVLAERGRPGARPNPLVGCVLLRGDEIVGEGAHERAGGPHAEVVALRAAGDAARGATAYVTLEPCDHQGRTGPCSQALIQAGVAEVVYALADPDPDAAGGHGRLVGAGVAVRHGLLADWAASQNVLFVHTRRYRRPFVVLKLAQTLDGSLEIPTGRDWITGAEARAIVHRRRALADAVVVGSGTVLADDPRLTVRHVTAPAGQPRAVVLDARGRTPPGARLIVERGRGEADPATLVLTTPAAASSWVQAVTDAGAEVETVVPGPAGGLDLHAALALLFERGLRQLLVEGGARVAASLVRAGLVDELVLHIATIVGPAGLPAVAPCAVPPSAGGWSWQTEKVGHLGRDLEIVAVPSQPPNHRPDVLEAP